MLKPHASPRILVVGVDWIGDVLCSTPVLRAIRKRFPGCFLAYSTSRGCVDILKGNPHVDHLLCYDETTFLGGLLRHLRFFYEVRRLRFDTVLFLHRSATRAFVAFLAGIGDRIGIQTRKRNWMLTHALPGPKARLHRVDLYLHLLKGLRISAAGREPDIVVGDEERADWHGLKTRSILEDGRPYVVLHPGGNWDLKRWPVENFVRVMRYLENCEICTVICGTAREIHLSETILSASRAGNVVSFCGKTRLMTLAAMIQESRLLVSNDSGPIHVAAALGTPVVGVFGPTSPAETGPVARGPMRLIHRRVGCVIPCYFQDCHHRVCMEHLGADEVIEAIEELMRGRMAVAKDYGLRIKD